MNDQLFIPQRIKVGYQSRKGTYTGKLAYVIYFDAKGVLRKEKSWSSWRDNKIDPNEFENVPTEGFVLNKTVGGYKSDWNYRSTYARIYDPRGFEFEISIPNLLFILQETDCTKGKGLLGEFVYAWEGTELVLLPVGSETYKKCVRFSGLQGKKISARDLICGGCYETKRQEKVIYLGRFDVYENISPPHTMPHEGEASFPLRTKKRKHVFCNEKGENIELKSSVDFLSVCVEETPTTEYAKFLDNFKAMPASSKIIDLKFVGTKKVFAHVNYCGFRGKNLFIKDGEHYKLQIHESDGYFYNKEDAVVKLRSYSKKYFLKEGEVWAQVRYGARSGWRSTYDNKDYIEQNDVERMSVGKFSDYKDRVAPKLVAVLENGKQVDFSKVIGLYEYD